ncbi:thyrostimulin beta-5 subunit-like [Pectinophora gossypiella]|uniref:thyrostimulin beta-5 subunit-like n=1 Tax=Pectinophora gossypiella TaxID=13191 RepID=UPI00214F3FA5|nr:thyrostimulin beta-5 subunit-like [Pectinophora gossypiella]
MSDHRQWLVTLALVLYLTACLAATTRCRPKYHMHKAVQTDLKGRKCWDNVKIQSCGGFCLSYEISHWQFPYKESHHPVCVHNERRHKFVKLRHCDAGVDPNTEDYHYVEAASCKCKICSSEDTSCEWLPPDSNLLDELLITEEEIEEELD